MRSYLKTRDYFKSKEEFELLLDEDLELLKTSPQPETADAYYESEDYISHTDAKADMVSKLYQLVKSYNLKKKVNLINRYAKKKESLLDFGAGTGDFLLAASKKGWYVTGIEPSKTARQLSKNKGQYLKEALNDVENEVFEVITLWHVLEHLPHLNIHIKQFASLLPKDGVLIIAVPNFKSFDAKYYGKYWAAYDVPRHLWHFSQKAIKKLFENQGFSLVATKPMIFDGFYVSLLSEKYKKSSFQWVRGFFIGLISNLKAVFTGEYSSLIYILVKNKD